MLQTTEPRDTKANLIVTHSPYASAVECPCGAASLWFCLFSER